MGNVGWSTPAVVGRPTPAEPARVTRPVVSTRIPPAGKSLIVPIPIGVGVPLPGIAVEYRSVPVVPTLRTKVVPVGAGFNVELRTPDVNWKFKSSVSPVRYALPA